jgi:hypothetical protein
MSRWELGDRAKCIEIGDIRLPLRTAIHRGGQFLALGVVYPVRGVSVHYGIELCLDVGAEAGPKLARRFVKVPPEEASSDVASGEKVPA